jgi:hypothetical protein
VDHTAIVLSVIGVILSAITIFAIYYGPIKALKIQRELDDQREERNRKVNIFKSLMSNRSTRLTYQYVQALNLIDVEFTGSSDKEKAVREAWKELHDLYSNYKTTPNAEERSTDLNIALLGAMARCLGYDFDKVHLKRGGYYPEFFGRIEAEQHTLRGPPAVRRRETGHRYTARHRRSREYWDGSVRPQHVFPARSDAGDRRQRKKPSAIL